MIVFQCKKKIQYAIYDLLDEQDIESSLLEEAIKDMWLLEYKENKAVDEIYDIIYNSKKYDKEMHDLIYQVRIYLIRFQ